MRHYNHNRVMTSWHKVDVTSYSPVSDKFFVVWCMRHKSDSRYYVDKVSHVIFSIYFEDKKDAFAFIMEMLD